MRRAWEEFRIAGGFLTIFPVAEGLSTEPERLARSMAFFPAIGLLLGLGLVVMDSLLTPLIPRQVVDSLLVLVLIAVTGALHLDGVADLCDGLAGGKDRESTLRIMKDSRVGAVGVIGLVMVLFLKYLTLHNVPVQLKSAALIFMPAAGRWTQVMLATYCGYIRPGGGTGGAFVDNVGERELLVASLTLLLAAPVLFGFKGMVVLAFLGLGALLMLRYFRARLGGVTGDVLGAASEIMEVFALLLVLALKGV